MMRWPGSCPWLFALALGACEPGSDIRIELERPDAESLDPYAPEAGVAKVRLVVRGDQRGEEAVVDAAPGSDVLEVRAFPAERVGVEVFGFDEVGNVRAYGRLPRRAADGGLRARVPFRRNLAYFVHAPNPGQNAPEGVIYVVDVVTRTLVDRVRLAGSAPRATSISARGGRSMLVTVTEGFDARLVELSTFDHTMTSIDLDARPDVVLGIEATDLAVAIGGSRVAFVDLEAGRQLDGSIDVGGRVLDAALAPSGARALAAVDVFPPGLLEIDVDRREVRGENIIANPGGIALDRRTSVAYVVSTESRAIVGYDLETGRSSPLESAPGLVASMGSPSGRAVFSDHMSGFFAVRDPRDGSQPQIYPFSVLGRAGTSRGIPTFFDVRGIAADGPGRRVVVAGAGTSTRTAGITVIDTELDELEPAFTNTLYPLDPDDTSGPFGQRQRYQPAGVAVVYGG
jgi:hypothetical protein